MSVLTIGTFDLLHSGHLNLLRRASNLGAGGFAGYGLTVGVNSDRFARGFKRMPLMPETERMAVVAALPWVQEVRLHEGHTPDFIDRVSPSVLVVGSDWARKDYYAQLGIDQDWLDARCITLAYVPYTAGVSTTVLLEREHGGC